MKFLSTLILATALALGIGGCSSPPFASSVQASDNSFVWVDSNRRHIVSSYRDTDTVTLTFWDGQRETLRSAVSASGARYVNRNNEWWEHQGEATYRSKGKLVFKGSRPN